MTQLASKEFWQGRRTLITGHTGFKGSWLSLWLQALGAKLMGIALAPPTNPSLFCISGISNEIDHRVVDIRDFKEIWLAIDKFRPEIIIHMAAQSLVRHSYQNPVETFSTNVMGTVHILQAARMCGSVKSIVNVTTDKCYQNHEWPWPYRENDSLGGNDPYSTSKACAELVSSAFRESFFQDSGISIATARAGNVIGGGDWSNDRLVPDVLRSLQNDESILIRNPNSVRPWQHVLEPLNGYLLLAERLHTDGHDYAEAWNFGPNDDDSCSVAWVVENLCQNWGKNPKWDIQSGPHPPEASHLRLDVSKARQRLNWAPRWNLETALKQVTRWHQSWMSGRNMRSFCLDQISEYGTLQ